jgi:hypothetical protein
MWSMVAEIEWSFTLHNGTRETTRAQYIRDFGPCETRARAVRRARGFLRRIVRTESPYPWPDSVEVYEFNLRSRRLRRPYTACEYTNARRAFLQTKAAARRVERLQGARMVLVRSHPS